MTWIYQCILECFFVSGIYTLNGLFYLLMYREMRRLIACGLILKPVKFFLNVLQPMLTVCLKSKFLILKTWAFGGDGSAIAPPGKSVKF